MIVKYFINMLRINNKTICNNDAKQVQYSELLAVLKGLGKSMLYHTTMLSNGKYPIIPENIYSKKMFFGKQVVGITYDFDGTIILRVKLNTDYADFQVGTQLCLSAILEKSDLEEIYNHLFEILN